MQSLGGSMGCFNFFSALIWIWCYGVLNSLASENLFSINLSGATPLGIDLLDFGINRILMNLSKQAKLKIEIKMA